MRRVAVRPVLWLIGASLLLLFAFLSWRRPSEPVTLKPATPLDGTNGVLAEEWRFLDQVRNFVPPGATYTVLAAELPREMTLFMMSCGLFPRDHPLPSSYHNFPQRAYGAPARYVLAFPCGAADGRSLRRVATNRAGCVFVRIEAPR